MTDIVERLRDKHCCDNGCHCDEAAAEIERLRAALEEIEQVALSYVHMKYAKLARAALTQEKPND
jgi:hypothetical protein